MRFTNVRVHDLEESIIKSGYPMLTEQETEDNFNLLCKFLGEYIKDPISSEELIEPSLFKELDRHYKRAVKLANCKPSSGHNNFEKGIVVSFDLEFSHTVLPQLQRYHWFEIVSSNSKMHRILKGDFGFTERTLPIVKETLFSLIETYNNFEAIQEAYGKGLIEKYGSDVILIDFVDGTLFPDDEFSIVSKADLFNMIIDNCPMGLTMTMAVTTNYLQLKNMYNQRKGHKLYEWIDFKNFCEKLPLFKEFNRRQ